MVPIPERGLLTAQQTGRKDSSFKLDNESNTIKHLSESEAR